MSVSLGRYALYLIGYKLLEHTEGREKSTQDEEHNGIAMVLFGREVHFRELLRSDHGAGLLAGCCGREYVKC